MLLACVCVAMAHAEIPQIQAGLYQARHMPGIVIDVGANGGRVARLAVAQERAGIERHDGGGRMVARGVGSGRGIAAPVLSVPFSS